MLGTRLRCWMETHIVRARKKQNRAKGKGKSIQDSPSTSPHINYDSSAYSVDKAPMTVEQKEKGNNGVTNLSSPESAYSTGYSTDGTSPGASIPPEYYINLRTAGGCGLGPGVNNGGPLTPSSARRRREEAAAKRKVKPPSHGLPESSTEEDIADRSCKPTPSHKAVTPKSQHKFLQPPTNGITHRRTESYDESHNLIFNITPPSSTTAERDSEGSSSTHTGGSFQCTSPFLSSASPRQRNRIRTNPWLGANANLLSDKTKNYYSPGETSSTVGSSSTLSKPVDRKIEDIKNLNMIRSATYVTSPLVNGRRPINTVTTCSPQPNRPCRHTRPNTSSSSSSAPTSGSDDNHHGNTSDFSDDDVTLNEMLGKYDESYVYEKETDILSDSDPTDCEEQHDYNDNSSLHTSEHQDDLDFIDNGSIAELPNSDTEFPDKILNKGHCTYVSANHTPEACKRQCSRMRRQRSGGEASAPSSRGSSLNNRRVRRASSRQREDSSEITPRRFKKKQRQPSRERKRASNELPQIVQNTNRSIKAVTVNESDKKNVDQSRHINLNRVLMERLMSNQRSGTRSADGTPVSLRRNGTHEYNGKYLRNPHVSKLINSNCNLVERRTSIEERNVPKSDGPSIKKRSNSLTGYNAMNPPNPPPRNPVRIENNSIDKEGDIKYRKLIQEAENILEDFHLKPCRPDYMSPTLSTKSAIFPCPSPIGLMPPRFPDESIINSQISLLEETINNNPVPKIENEEGIFKTISKTLEKIIIRNSDSKRNDKNGGESLKSKKKNRTKVPKPVPIPSVPPPPPVNVIPQITYCQEHDYVNNEITVDNASFTDRNDNLYRNTYSFSPRHRTPTHNNTRTQFRQNGNPGDKEHFRNTKGVDIIRNGEYSPLNLSPKMSPMNRNIPRNSTLSIWQERPVINNAQQNDTVNVKIIRNNEIPIKPTLVPFKSFDLGNKVAINSKYCPQSEPVKRKVYAGSNTFGKLQKTLMRNESEKDCDIENMSTDALRGNSFL
ncbi:hypothetical protein O3M35_007593 [Rhynocoris fuscipes]|uniref:Uncharacterized protein n=1 Tax=Rhynocoris fuscipes TaxID=488301 RepID=A0AAW1DH68_9HEMI